MFCDDAEMKCALCGKMLYSDDGRRWVYPSFAALLWASGFAYFQLEPAALAGSGASSGVSLFVWQPSESPIRASSSAQCAERRMT